MSAANQMVATLMARQGDSQLALSTPALLTDQYLSQRGLHGLSTSAARNVLSLPDHAQDFGICQIFHIDTYYSVCLSLTCRFQQIQDTFCRFLIPYSSI